MHPVTRIGRVLQQIRSFTTLHASELEGLAGELEAAGHGELAARLRVFQGLHSQEAGLILDELADIQADLDRQPPPGSASASATGSSAGGQPTVGAGLASPAATAPADEGSARADPAANSPKRARWLAEQARQAEEERRPRSRRDLFKRG